MAIQMWRDQPFIQILKKCQQSFVDISIIALKFYMGVQVLTTNKNACKNLLGWHPNILFWQ